MTSHNLQEFEARLRALIGSPTNLRPFVCDGSPLRCNVFIVGFNPATMISADFWQFWQTDYGFNKTAWFEAYREERRSRPLKAGKKRRNPISNTRRVVEWILDAASPVRCLETNLYAAPTEQATDLISKQRITAPFDFLVASIAPRIIITHGDDAAKHIRSKNVSAKIISVSHFSRGWSQECARDLGAKIKTLIGSNETGNTC
jgi:hypothetical protein